MLDFFEYSDAVQKLIKWTKSYDIGKPDVSDKVYDDLYKQVKQFELAHPNEIDKDSPTQKVHGVNSDGTFQKVTHDIPMISISNSNSEKELESFCNDKIKKNCTEFVMEYKIDGAALSLKYEDGELQDAITRGKGGEGDRVFANALKIPAIKQKISKKGKVEIRGEVVWLKDDFMAWNNKMESLGEELLSNPRNGAAGTLKLKDPQEVADRKLSFLAYSVVAGSDFDTHSEDLEWLKKEGFTTSESYICKSTDKVIKGSRYMDVERHKQPFLIDGLVIKVNDKTAYKRLGGTSKSPHYCTALKFPPEEKTTKLKYIEHSYGRSGAVTPVSIVEEVELSLTKVRRASLHNWDIVDYLGLYEGCSIVMRKAAEIIPEVLRVEGIDGRSKDEYEIFVDGGGDLRKAKKELRGKYNHVWHERPTECEHCKTTLKQDTNRAGDILVAWICPNNACPVKQFKNIVKFVSRDCMDISGVSESVIEKLLNKGYIKNITDLYKVTKDQLLTLDSFGERSADKFLASVSASRNNYMHQLLPGLGIPSLGKTAAKIFSEHFDDLESFHQAQKTELESIDGIGSELADNIVDFRKDGGNRYLFRWFIDNNICTQPKKVKKSSNKLEGLTLIMTGKFDSLGRNTFKDLVAQNGGKVASGISKNVNFVLFGMGAGPSKSAKIDDLQKNGHDIKKITDEDFMKMIE